MLGLVTIVSVLLSMQPLFAAEELHMLFAVHRVSALLLSMSIIALVPARLAHR